MENKIIGYFLDYEVNIIAILETDFRGNPIAVFEYDNQYFASAYDIIETSIYGITKIRLNDSNIAVVDDINNLFEEDCISSYQICHINNILH